MTSESGQYFARRAQRGDVVIKELPKFDLESYISNYEGKIRQLRLLHIAEHSPPLSLEALHIAIPDALDSKDPGAYLALVTLIGEIEPADPLAKADSQWVERKNKENKRETERLEQELRGYKNNLIKESIRMGQEDLATHYLTTSNFEEATKSFQRMREFCTTPKHVAEMTLKLVLTSLLSKNWLLAQSHCAKARVLTMKPEEKAKFDPVIDACSGLAFLGIKDYNQAARAFLRVHASYLAVEPLGNIAFQKQVLTGNDIAVYGGLTALAVMNRDELRTQVLENADFRTFLELESHIRAAISSFCEGKFSACLGVLESYRNDYLLDVFLAPYIPDLYARIRSKSIVQYLVPFSHVRIHDLAKAFPRAGKDSSPEAAAFAMEQELAEMIQSGLLDARIDAVDQLLLSPPRDARAEMQQGVLDTASEIEHSLRLKLHRLNMLQAGLELSNPKGGKGFKSGGVGTSPWDGPEMGTPMSNA